jgi:hypothetical protein
MGPTATRGGHHALDQQNFLRLLDRLRAIDPAHRALRAAAKSREAGGL